MKNAKLFMSSFLEHIDPSEDFELFKEHVLNNKTYRSGDLLNLTLNPDSVAWYCCNKNLIGVLLWCATSTAIVFSPTVEPQILLLDYSEVEIIDEYR